MFEYLRLLRRPTKVQPRDHSNRVETLVRFSNKLPGLSPDMNSDQVKQMVFDQHPEAWRKFYIRSRTSLATDTLADIVQFMSNEKGFADGDDEKRQCKRQHDNNYHNKQKNKKQKMGNNNDKEKGEWDLYQGVPDTANCPKHGSGHTSGECKHNPFKKLAKKRKMNSGQYRGNQQQGGQGGGRNQGYQGPPS
eukprot:15357851-Ditylum_brightwellii.AAC.1